MLRTAFLHALAHALALAITIAALPARADDDVLARGRVLFDVRCALCHAGHQSTIADAVRVAAGRPEAIRAAIANIGAMNYLATSFTDADLEAIAAYLASREDASRRFAVEYRHATNGHYFVTAHPDEIAALDARRGTLEPWLRTSLAFAVDLQAADGRLPVCRFFTAAFAARGSHFYSIDPAECDAVRRNPDWIDEGVAFQARSALAGACPAGTRPLFRLYNDGRGGAPNHRYSIDPAVRDAMLAEGFLPEGPAGGVAMCVPR
jgi:cytochrome c5